MIEDIKNIFFDTETLSVDHDGLIVQLSGIIEINGEEVERFDFFTKPFAELKPYIDKECLRFHLQNKLFTKEDAVNFDTPQDTYKKFTTVLSKYVNPKDKHDSKYNIIGYNSQFDVRNLRKWFELADPNNRWAFNNYFNWCDIDVMRILRFVMLDYVNLLSNFKLSTVYDWFTERGICDRFEGMAHNAQYDNIMCREIYKKVLLPLRGELNDPTIR